MVTLTTRKYAPTPTKQKMNDREPEPQYIKAFRVLFNAIRADERERVLASLEQEIKKDIQTAMNEVAKVEAGSVTYTVLLSRVATLQSTISLLGKVKDV